MPRNAVIFVVISFLLVVLIFGSYAKFVVYAYKTRENVFCVNSNTVPNPTIITATCCYNEGDSKYPGSITARYCTDCSYNHDTKSWKCGDWYRVYRTVTPGLLGKGITTTLGNVGIAPTTGNNTGKTGGVLNPIGNAPNATGTPHPKGLPGDQNPKGLLLNGVTAPPTNPILNGTIPATIAPSTGNNTGTAGNTSVFNPIGNATNAPPTLNGTTATPTQNGTLVHESGPPLGNAKNPRHNTGLIGKGITLNGTVATTGNPALSPPPPCVAKLNGVLVPCTPPCVATNKLCVPLLNGTVATTGNPAPSTGNSTAMKGVVTPLGNATNLGNAGNAGQQTQTQQTTGHHHKGSNTDASTSTGNSTGH